MCRQYNDYGSAARDADEGNLNSLDFPDFREDSPDALPESGTDMSNGEDANANGDAVAAHVSRDPMKKAKEQLMEIAEFERECMQLAMRRLRQNVDGTDATKALQVYIDVTDVFGQIYVQKDIASRLQNMDGMKA